MDNTTTTNLQHPDDIRSLCALALQEPAVEANGYWGQIKRIARTLVKHNITDESIREAIGDTEHIDLILHSCGNFRIAQIMNGGK
jgi:hypothetical protein